MIAVNTDIKADRKIKPSETVAARRRRIGRRAGAAVAVLAFEILSGCGGASRPIKYYQLTLPGAIAPATTTPRVPVTIVVRRLLTSTLYRDRRLVYSVGNQQIGTYEYERWVGPPSELIQGVFLGELRASGHYSGVYTPEGKAGGDYALHGRLYEFAEHDSGSNLVARLTMDLELSDTQTGATLWRRYYTHDEPVSAKNVPDVVAALDRNVQLAANDVAVGLEQYFAAHPVK